MIRKISAHYIYISKDELFKYGIVVFDTEGLIHDIVNTHGVPQESEKLEFFNGMVVPGFVNIDITNQPIDSTIIDANNIKHFLSKNSDNPCKYLILEKPENFHEADILQLMMLENKGIRIVLHFGNIKSSDQFSIFQYIRELQQKWNIRFPEILRWATINSAMALKIDDNCGSIDRNKKPGLQVVSGIDYPTMRLKENSSVSVII